MLVCCTCAGSREGRGISGYSCFNSGLKEGSRGLSRFMGYGVEAGAINSESLLVRIEEFRD